MNDVASSFPSPESGDSAPGSKTLVKWCLFIGVLTLVLAPVVTLKLAVWKYRQETAQKAEDAARVLAVKNGKLAFGGPFNLVDQNGVAVTDKTYRGKYLLIYFGYTYCPDICSTALQNIAETLNELGPEADKAQVLFVTVDPERDTPERLKEYVASFDPKIAGLTGTPKQIAAMAKKYGITYAKAKETEGGDYVLNHSTLMYVMSLQGKPLASMNMEQAEPASIAASLRHLWGLREEKPKPAPN